MMILIAPLAARRRVVALELQGHGRTSDSDRPLTLATLGDDVAGAIEALGLGRSDVVSFSYGADAALRAAIQHPTRVRRLVAISTAHARTGWNPRARRDMEEVEAGLAHWLTDKPIGKLAQTWPEPARFPQFLDKMGALLSQEHDWSSEIAKLSLPVMLMFGDHDAISAQHMIEFYQLLGGGMGGHGLQNNRLSRARLAVIPGYTHDTLLSAPELAPLIERFLAEPDC
jgi:pimeloyl-ACP methyl ester carboxylesterase